jgi:phenylalanyl-tRNA synthetase alpha chain
MLNKLKENFVNEIKKANNLETLENIYKKYLGRKGELTNILRSLKRLPEKERKQKGRTANQLKQEIGDILKQKRCEIPARNATHSVAGGRDAKHEIRNGWLDVSAPGVSLPEGHSHPISLVQKEVEDIFQSMGFSVIEGPEVETEYYNFDALNIPKNHPARDLWDTFWLKDVNLLLRTHTSPMQARYMEKHQPPLRIIVPGRCFRHEATDASHDVQFYQVEGLMVGQDISVVHFKGVIEGFLKRFFHPDIEMRLRPGYFPFTEPSFEIDARRKGQKWLELMGAGMVHQNVFKEAGYPLRKWQGFAFGMCPDRLAMLKYKIDDIRLFYSGDLRFLKQF